MAKKRANKLTAKGGVSKSDAKKTNPKKKVANLKNPLAQVVMRAWTDPAFKARLLADPQRELSMVGVQFEASNVVILENTADTKYLVLPERPSSLPLSDADLERLLAADPNTLVL